MSTSSRKQLRMSRKFKTVVFAVATTLLLSAVFANSQNRVKLDTPKTPATTKSQVKASSTPKSSGSDAAIPENSQDFDALENQLANAPTPSISNAVTVVNQNEPVIYAKEWQSEHIKYGDLDQLNRATTATAYLSKNNLGKSEGREPQTFRPTGWHNQPKTINGKRVFPQNRGHLIAYTLTFNLDASGNQKQGALGSLDNPKNLVTQTAYSNQELMQIYEQKVRDALAANKQVVYQVTPIFKDTELMARGLWLQAESTDDTLKFSVYIANVQPDLTFNYATGQSAKQHL